MNSQLFRVVKEEYLEQYDDVRLHALKFVQKVVQYRGCKRRQRGG